MPLSQWPPSRQPVLPTRKSLLVENDPTLVLERGSLTFRSLDFVGGDLIGISVFFFIIFVAFVVFVLPSKVFPHFLCELSSELGVPGHLSKLIPGTVLLEESQLPHAVGLSFHDIGGHHVRKHGSELVLRDVVFGFNHICALGGGLVTLTKKSEVLGGDSV